MSLGNGCVWKKECNYKANGYHLQNYCNDDCGWRKCPHRPANDGNLQIQKDYNTAKSRDDAAKRRSDDAAMGRMLFILTLLAGIIGWLLKSNIL